jgi:hypothetical protein
MKYEIIEINKYFNLQYFGNAKCIFRAKIIAKNETDNIIIRYIK